MSPDPVAATLQSIDQAVDAHERWVAESMSRNAERFHPFGPSPDTAISRGWVPKVSPPSTRYEPVRYAVVAPYALDARRFIAEYRERRAIRPEPEPFGNYPIEADFGPVPRPALTDAGPAETTLPNDVPRRRRDWVWLLVALAFAPAFVYAIAVLTGWVE